LGDARSAIRDDRYVQQKVVDNPFLGRFLAEMVPSTTLQHGLMDWTR
jgi:hypothetical protein